MSGTMEHPSTMPIFDALLPDVILWNGKVVTVDEGFSVAQALAIKGERIVAVGSNADLTPLAGSHTQMVDLEGKMVLPGINDAHIHLASFGATRPPVSLDLSYPRVKSIADVVTRLREKIATLEPGQWVRGFGWDESYLAECQHERGRRPTRWDLDEVSPENPVAFGDFTGGHILWVNTAALRIAGIAGDTPDPEGGNILRDASGEPSGLLNEPGATQLVSSKVPPLSGAEKRAAILAAMAELNRLGVTSVTEPGLGHVILGAPATDREVASIYSDLYAEGLLTLRVSYLLMFSDIFEGGRLDLATLEQYLKHVGFHTGFGNEWLRIAGIKLYSDSMPLNKTSWMNEEYEGGGHGGLLVTGDSEDARRDELIKIINYASKRRFQCGVHSTGDRAVDAVVEGFARALDEDPWDARHYVIHADYVTPHARELMAHHQIGAAMQSLIKWTIADFCPSLVGEERAANEWPFKSLVSAGIHVANSSDAPVTYPDWKMGLEVSVTRESKGSGKVSGAHERLTREEAIRCYTIEGAWIDHLDHMKGSIEVGKLADLCVLDGDLLDCEVHEIHTISTVLTMVGGKIVYDGTESD